MVQRGFAVCIQHIQHGFTSPFIQNIHLLDGHGQDIDEGRKLRNFSRVDARVKLRGLMGTGFDFIRVSSIYLSS
jgi:hypothetical protein